jgi:hypothetical protein
MEICANAGNDATVSEGEALTLSQGADVDSLLQEITVYPLGMSRESTAFVAGSGPSFLIPTWSVTVLPSCTGLGKPPPAPARRSALGGGFSPFPLSKTLG